MGKELKVILEKIMSAVDVAGNRTAIHTSEGEISYNFLWEKSDILANWIEEKLQDNKKPIVVYGHKNPLMLVCFLACVKSGRAYCPVDTSMAAERVEEIVKTIDNNLVLATEELEIEGRYVAGKEIINGIVIKGDPIDKKNWIRPNDVFYIIFTSGSTGKPKGVQITESNLNNFITWAEDFRKNKLPKVFLNQAPFSFDLSVMDLYTSMCTGGTLWCVDKEIQKDTNKLMKYLREGKIKFWVSTPSFVDMCLADKNFDKETLPEIETFWFCGERLTKDTASKLLFRFPEAEIINAYGPTESTVAVTAARISREMVENKEELSIGTAKPETRIEIDEENGEIIICGDTVGCGYFKDNEKTDKVFFRRKIQGEEELCYRSGDSGYFKNGLLFYKGRIDKQIKLHGYRIELGDIESNLLYLNNVSAAAVLPKNDGGKIKYLVAFLVSPGNSGNFEERKKIKAELKKALPEYMIPKKIVFLDEMPMTGNGKTDRNRLEEMLG